MNSTSFKIALCLLALAFIVPTTAPAQKYTTQGAKSKKADKEKKPVCTNNNMKDIDSFDRRAVKKNAEIQALHYDFKSYATKDKSEDFIRELAKLNSFFKSEDYEEMKILYDLCGVEMPTVYEDKPFWMP